MAALGQSSGKQVLKRQQVKAVKPDLAYFKMTNRRYRTNHPQLSIDKSKAKHKEDNPKMPQPSDILADWSPEEDESIKENIETIQRYHLELTANITTKATVKPFHQKYGTIPPRDINKHTFQDYIKKYEPTTVWEQLDKDRIVTNRNITLIKGMSSILKGIDNTDELLSLQVENGNAKLPVQVDGRRFRAGVHNTDQPMLGFNYMHIHQYIIELMKQAIYQARNRMIFMQDLRNRHRRSGLYKMGFLFAKADSAGKVFSSVSLKAFRMCSTLRQGVAGMYRPFMHYLDIVYALERMETKWFDVDLLSDMIVMNDQMVKEQIFKNKKLNTPRDLQRAFNKMFIE